MRVLDVSEAKCAEKQTTGLRNRKTSDFLYVKLIITDPAGVVQEAHAENHCLTHSLLLVSTTSAGVTRAAVPVCPPVDIRD